MNPFDVLGIAPTLDLSLVKQGYYSALRKYPPHEHPERFQEIRSAYEVLLTENGRKNAFSTAPRETAADLETFRALEAANHEEARQWFSSQHDVAMVTKTLFAWASKRTLAEVQAALAQLHTVSESSAPASASTTI